MEGKTANQSELEGEIPNEKVEEETPGGDGDKDDIDEEKVELSSDKEIEWQTPVAKVARLARLTLAARLPRLALAAKVSTGCTIDCQGNQWCSQC